MNHDTTDFIKQLTAELRNFLSLCEEALALAMRENQALSDGAGYQPAEYSHRRKELLPSLEKP